MRPLPGLFLLPALLLALAAPLALAQPDTAAEEALRRLSKALEGASFHFSYRLWASPEATSAISGEGWADLDAQRWSYTLRSDPGDPQADRGADGEWVIVAGRWYHRGADGAWGTERQDFSFTGVSAILAPFASYDNLRRLAGDDTERLEELRWLGRETLDGLEADRYAFATHGLAFYGEATFEAWLSEDGQGGFQRIVLVFSQEDGRSSRVDFNRIGEPAPIEAPL